MSGERRAVSGAWVGLKDPSEPVGHQKCAQMHHVGKRQRGGVDTLHGPPRTCITSSEDKQVEIVVVGAYAGLGTHRIYVYMRIRVYIASFCIAGSQGCDMPLTLSKQVLSQGAASDLPTYLTNY